VHAHVADLRSELPDLDAAARERLLAAVAGDWRGAEAGALGEVDRALCAYAEKLTRTPAAMTEADLAPLRARGLSDAAIHDAIQVVSYFNYINRVADAVHVDLEPEMPPYP
jgi:uncharacterized peroxidase-related enzyme